jgi:hypothetical protein
MSRSYTSSLSQRLRGVLWNTLALGKIMDTDLLWKYLSENVQIMMFWGIRIGIWTLWHEAGSGSSATRCIVINCVKSYGVLPDEYYAVVE